MKTIRKNNLLPFICVCLSLLRRGPQAFGRLLHKPFPQRGDGAGAGRPLSGGIAAAHSHLLPAETLHTGLRISFRIDSQTVHVHPQSSKLPTLFQFTFTLFTLYEVPEGTHLIRDASLL